jgi:hypothetical protein
MGHHPSAFKLFIRALLDLGCTVLALCPKPEEVDSSLQDLDTVVRSRLTLRSTAWAPAPRGCPRRFKRRAQTLRSVYRVRKRIRQWEAEQGKSVELVFFACIYDFQFRFFREAEWLFPYRWSGLYLHARSFRMPGSPIPYVGELPCPEKFFALKSLHSAALLDEGAVTGLKHVTGGKLVVVFPDLTDMRLPAQGDPAWGLANKLRGFARGRPIVSLVGHLQRTKGLEEFTYAAQDESLRGLFFFLGGEVNWVEISDSSRKAMLTAWEQSPNLFAHLQRIADERALNAVIASSDIIYAAYTDFPNSSGILSKAAVFERPLIVSDGYLMAERTRAYNLGEVVKERDMDGIKAALRRLGGLEPAAGNTRPAGWQAYRAAHSYEKLMGAFAELLGQREGPSVDRDH